MIHYSVDSQVAFFVIRRYYLRKSNFKEDSKYLLGKLGEQIAATYYEEQNFRIVSRNWRWSNKGEIDVIAYNRDINLLVFCEVKTRKYGCLISGCYAVNTKKQSKIRTLAQVFILKNTQYSLSSVRFDVFDIVYDTESGIIEKNILENAF